MPHGAVEMHAEDADGTGLTGAEAIRAVRAALDRLRRAAAVRDHLAAALALLDPPDGTLGEGC